MLEHELIELLRPTVRALVRDEVRRARMEWRWRTVRQTAELLDISEKAVRTRCERGQLPHKKIGGKLLVDLTALERLLE